MIASFHSRIPVNQNQTLPVWAAVCRRHFRRLASAAASTSPLLDQSPASRSVSGPLRSWRMCVDRLESFSKRLTAENHCANSRKTATWAGGLPLTIQLSFLQIYQEPKNDGECLYNIKEFLKGCTSFRVEVSPPFLQIFEDNGALLPHPWVYFFTLKWRLWMCSVYRTRARWDPGTVNNGSMELLTEGGGGNNRPRTITHQPQEE